MVGFTVYIFLSIHHQWMYKTSTHKIKGTTENYDNWQPTLTASKYFQPLCDQTEVNLIPET